MGRSNLCTWTLHKFPRFDFSFPSIAIYALLFLFVAVGSNLPTSNKRIVTVGRIILRLSLINRLRKLSQRALLRSLTSKLTKQIFAWNIFLNQQFYLILFNFSNTTIFIFLKCINILSYRFKFYIQYNVQRTSFDRIFEIYNFSKKFRNQK